MSKTLQEQLKEINNSTLHNKSRKHQDQSEPSPQIQNTQPAPSTPQLQQAQYEFTSLYTLGLQVLEQGNNFVVVGEDLFHKKDSIKACGFF